MQTTFQTSYLRCLSDLSFIQIGSLDAVWLTNKQTKQTYYYNLKNLLKLIFSIFYKLLFIFLAIDIFRGLLGVLWFINVYV